MRWARPLATAALLTGLGLLQVEHATAWQAGRAGLNQYVNIGPEPGCPTGIGADVLGGGHRVCYSPAQEAEIYVDATCPSGYMSFLVVHGVRVCYTPDAVAENSNLQGRCASDPSLYICPD